MHDFEYLLRTHGHLAVLIFAFMEGQTAIIVAGFLARQGFLDPYLVALYAFCGTSVSDQLYFSLSRWKGASFLRHFPRISKGVMYLSAKVHGSEAALTFCFRFIYGIRNITPFFLGISPISTRLFIPLNILGAAAWAVACTVVGYFFGHIYAEGTGIVKYAGLAAPVVLSAAWPAYKIFQAWKKRRKSRQG